ncbi:MAG TPA: hypothetical protein VGS78_06330 [Candidatus Sulfotelmatobacter sp.]|nr:hypothetical protein [Candidatus Sulfotelmatobacter sp.]
MRPTLLALLCLSAALISAQDVKIDRTGDSPVEAKFAPGGSVHMTICPGGIDLVGTNDPVVRVSYHPERDDVRVRIEVTGNRADLRLTGCPHNNFRARIEVPKSSGLYVRMFAGQLNINQITGDKDAELTFGQMNIEAGKPQSYSNVDASVNSGAIDADAFDIHKGGLFRSFERSGPGNLRLHAHIGAGQIEIN